MVSFLLFLLSFVVYQTSSRLFVPPFVPFNFTNSASDVIPFEFCAMNSTVHYPDIFPILVNESSAFLQLFADAGGLIKYFEENFNFTTGEFPDEFFDLFNNTPLWGGLECCIHPSSFLNLTFNFGCPANVTVCVFDPTVDYNTQVVALYRPAGCCPVESPNGCFTRRRGNGLVGCCPDEKPNCCFNSMTNKWLGCVDDPGECCDDKICPYGYTCCRSKVGTGTVCCPRYGASCFDQDYFVYGLNRSVHAVISEYYDDMDPDEQPVKLGEHFGLIYGYHGCIPEPGGEFGPVSVDLYISNETDRYADDYCDDKAQRTTYRLRPSLRRYAKHPDDLDSNGIPYYSFGAIDPEDYDLQISAEAARFGSLEDLNFTSCGRHLCYGERDYCVYRYVNETRPINHRVVNVTDIIYAYELLVEESEIDTNIEPPIPPDFEYLEYLNETCHMYNDTYLEQLINDRIYDGLVTGVGVNPYFEYLLPFDCLIFDIEYFLDSEALGCCPKNSTPCAGYPHSLTPEVRAEWPRMYSIFDPMLGCAMEGETCCGAAVCPVGFKCCNNRFTADGGMGPIVPNNKYPNSTSIVNMYLRPGMLYDLLVNATPEERTYITDILDVHSTCCPTYSFCCQIDASFASAKTHRRFFYYCSVDPLCKIPIWNVGPSGITGGVVQKLRGYPSQMIEDDFSLDYDSDGIFNYVTDILETYIRTYPVIYESPQTRRGNSNNLNDVKCTLTVKDVGPIMECGQLAGNFSSGSTENSRLYESNPSSVEKNPLRKIGGAVYETPSESRRGERSFDVLSHYPPPPETNPVEFDILDYIFSINVTNIFTIETPLHYYFVQKRDYTIQLVLEGIFGLTFIGFPPADVWIPPSPSPSPSPLPTPTPSP